MAELAANKNIRSASDLKIGHLVLIKNHHKGPSDPTYIYNHQVAEIINDNMVLLTTPDGKEKKCNIHHVKPVSSLEVYVGSQAEVSICRFPNFRIVSSRTLKVPALMAVSICITQGQNISMVSIHFQLSSQLDKKSIWSKPISHNKIYTHLLIILTIRIAASNKSMQ